MTLLKQTHIPFIGTVIMFLFGPSILVAEASVLPRDPHPGFKQAIVQTKLQVQNQRIARKRAPSNSFASTRRIKNDKSEAPTISPQPSITPSSRPSNSPTISMLPTTFPTRMPSNSPSAKPSFTPTNEPTLSSIPSYNPSMVPTLIPTALPSQNPTNNPTASPSESPSQYPQVADSSESKSSTPHHDINSAPSSAKNQTPPPTTVSSLSLGYDETRMNDAYIQTCRHPAKDGYDLVGYLIDYTYSVTLLNSAHVAFIISEIEHRMGQGVAHLLCNNNVYSDLFYLHRLDSNKLDTVAENCVAARQQEQCHVVTGSFHALVYTNQNGRRNNKNRFLVDDESVSDRVGNRLQEVVQTVMMDIIERISSRNAASVSSTIVNNLNPNQVGTTTDLTNNGNKTNVIPGAVAGGSIGIILLVVLYSIGVRRRARHAEQMMFYEETMEDFQRHHHHHDDLDWRGHDHEIVNKKTDLPTIPDRNRKSVTDDEFFQKIEVTSSHSTSPTVVGFGGDDENVVRFVAAISPPRKKRKNYKQQRPTATVEDIQATLRDLAPQPYISKTNSNAGDTVDL